MSVGELGEVWPACLRWRRMPTAGPTTSISKAEIGGRLPSPPASRCRNEREGPGCSLPLPRGTRHAGPLSRSVDGTADGFGLGLQEVRSGPEVEPAPMAPRSARRRGIVALDLGGRRLVGLVDLEEGSVTSCGVGVLRLPCGSCPSGWPLGLPFVAESAPAHRVNLVSSPRARTRSSEAACSATRLRLLVGEKPEPGRRRTLRRRWLALRMRVDS